MASNQAWDEVVDAVVVGTGCAGCAAAASALHHGLKNVILAEKSLSLVGGTTKLAGGGWLWAPNNRYLRELGVHQTKEEIFELLKDLAYSKENGVTPDKGDLDLMEAFASEWPSVLDEIIENKIMKLRPVTVREDEDAERVKQLLLRKAKETPNHEKITGISDKNRDELAKLMPSYCGENKLDLCPSGKVLAPDGSTTSLQLEKSAKKLGASLRMGFRIIDVVFDQVNGEKVAIGVVVEHTPKKGEKPKVLRVKASHGVIFASGGFSHNKELMAQNYSGNIPLGTCAAKTNTGDLIDIAKKHDIPISGLEFAWLKQIVLPYKFPERIGVFFLNGDSFFVVDRTGKRYANDRMFYQERGMQMFQNPDRRCVFFVYDARAADLYAGPIKSLGGPIPMQEEGMFEDCEIKGSNVNELADGIKKKLSEVAPDFKLDRDFAKNLEAQLKRFNEMSKTGVDLEFGRGDHVPQYCWSVPRAPDNKYKNKTMYPLDEKNLRCVIMGLSTLDTKGGPRINKTAEILGKDNKPIKNLYGAGNCIRSPTLYSYPASGATMAYGVLFGWIAGREAAKSAQGKLPKSKL